MSYNYGPLASKAVQLIAKYGSSVLLEFVFDSDVPADATRPWRGPNVGATQNYSPKGLVTTFDKNQINGDMIRSTDMQLLVAGQDPAVLQLIAAGYSMDDVQFAQTSAGGRLACQNLSPIVPGDTVMLYTLRLRVA